MNDIKIIFISTLTGGIVGAVFAYLILPIPAPSAFSGVSGIIGIYLGFKAIELLLIRHLKVSYTSNIYYSR